MITAEEAKRMTEAATLAVDLPYIEELIVEAAKAGQSYIAIKRSLASITIEKLREIGFVVEPNSDGDAWGIYW